MVNRRAGGAREISAKGSARCEREASARRREREGQWGPRTSNKRGEWAERRRSGEEVGEEEGKRDVRLEM